jgi:regulator of RNase E activity RraB
MVQNWTSYFTNLNDSVASIFVNLGLREDTPLQSHPWRLRVRVHFRNPRPDGLSNGDEAPTLFLIEDALNLQVDRACGGIPCGRITSCGMREFCFYARTNDGLRTAVELALAGFSVYHFELAETEDPAWEFYLNVLYPSEENLEGIKNRDLLDVLAKKGDIPSIAREVQHWLFFPSEESRSLFQNEAVQAGFRIGFRYEIEPQAHGDYTLCLTVFRTQPIVQNLIDDTVIELLRLAKRFGGGYDGWETQVTSE